MTDIGKIEWSPDFKSDFFIRAKEDPHLRSAPLYWVDVEDLYLAFKSRLISECYLPQIFEKDEK